MKKLQNFKANNLTEDQMRKIIGGAKTTYTDNKGGSGSDEASGGATKFDNGDSSPNGDVNTSKG
jgi:hypothetical protein